MSALIPAAGSPKLAKLPAISERTLDNGLRVIAARRPGVPLVSMALRIPGRGKPMSRAQSRMLEGAMLLGTERLDAVALAESLQVCGGDLSAHADADRIVLSGSSLAASLPAYLAVLDEVLRNASYPKREVSGERDRAQSEMAYLRSRPGVQATEAISSILFGDHAYGAPMPSDGQLAKADARTLRELHSERVVPKGAVLVLVGDETANKMLDAAEAALGGWKGSAKGSALRPAKLGGSSALTFVDRPGSVQTTLILGGPAVAPGHPDEAALALANMVFGGYFSSRLVDNIRERNGYTYSPRSGITQRPAASTFTVQADVANAVTAPALMEITYELSRMASLPVSEAELASAKAYLLGTSSIVLGTQSGVASTILRLSTFGLPWSFITDHGKALLATSVEEVRAAAERYLAPSALTAAAEGEGAVVRSGLAALGPVR